MSSYRGVIETATGDLLRAGYCDFENDGSFDSGTESIRTDVPRPSKIRGFEDNDKFHRWNGSAWVEIDNVGSPPDPVANPFGFRAYLGSAQTVGHQVQAKVKVDTVTYDPREDFDAVNFRYPIMKKGIYIAFGSVKIGGINDTKFMRGDIRINGVRTSSGAGNSTGDNIAVWSSVTDGYDLVVGDYIELFCFHQHGSDRSLAPYTDQTFFGAQLVGDPL